MDLSSLRNKSFRFITTTCFLLVILHSSKIIAANHNVTVKLISGATGNPIGGHKVSVFEKLANGSLKWFQSATSDGQGKIFLNLIGIPQGKRYLLRTKNPFDGTTKTSSTISSIGSKTFVIGNKLLHVNVSSGIDNKVLANQEVIIYQLQSDGSRKYFRKNTTDSNGHLDLDLDDLGSGRSYQLRTKEKYGTGFVNSGAIKATGNYAFKVGNARVKAVNGKTGGVLSNHKIFAYKLGSDGKYTWFATSTTESNGLADFQLSNLASGQKYIFKGTSLSDNRVWSSQVIKLGSTTNFIIGNKLLNVALVNALSQNPIANVEITAFQRMPDNSLKWTQKKTSDSKGLVFFDLRGLGGGSNYVLSTFPYGVKVLSKDITKTGQFKLEAGAVAVTLRKKSDNSLMKGRKLILFEKISTGKIKWLASAITGQDGKVRFDPKGLGTGKVFVIKAKDLFGNNKSYFSQWISSKGNYQFTVDPSDPHRLDETPPVFNSFQPSNNATLADKGFLIRMKVADNNKVANVKLQIVDPVKGVTNGVAVLANREWEFSVTSGMITKNQTIKVNAVAEDQSANKAKVSYSYSIISDPEKPKINLISHRDGDQIDENGFLLLGTTTDNTGDVQLVATVTDPINGVVIDQKAIEIGDNNHWALLAKDLPRGKEVKVKLTATDLSGNTETKNLSLPVMTEKASMIQLINRITFGATPELIKELRDFGSAKFIQRQLNPQLIDNSVFQKQLATLQANETNGYQRLQHSQVAAAIFSKHQLLEVMTQFWESHFNTDLGKVRYVPYEQKENNLFRKQALGNFGVLLKLSATSPAMLKYLDNKDSLRREPNENYARELMELHTLGVDNSYTSADIVEVARVFTGWTIQNKVFGFAKWAHDKGEKTLLGTVIPANSGVVGGQMVLDLLAKHDATAKHICSKLLQLFVADKPTQNSVMNCADDYLVYVDDSNQIAKVLEGIFNSAEFSASLNFHNKVKTPLEFFVGMARQFPVNIHYGKTRILLKQLGMPLFFEPEPTGWQEVGEGWVNSGQLTQRWQIARETLFNSATKWNNHIVDPVQFLRAQGIETTEGVIGYLFELALAHDYTLLEFNEALSLLTTNQTEAFDITAPDADEKIRRLMIQIMQYPSYQLQ